MNNLLIDFSDFNKYLILQDGFSNKERFLINSNFEELGISVEKIQLKNRIFWVFDKIIEIKKDAYIEMLDLLFLQNEDDLIEKIQKNKIFVN